MQNIETQIENPVINSVYIYNFFFFSWKVKNFFSINLKENKILQTYINKQFNIHMSDILL